MATIAADERLLTIEEFVSRPDQEDYPEELVRGRIVAQPFTMPRGGEIRGRVARLLNLHVETNRLRGILCIGSGVITTRNPDTLRAADISYYSPARCPTRPLPDGYIEVAPDLIVEVKSPSDRWPGLISRAGEYLEAGVSTVIVLDDETGFAHLFDAEGHNQILGPDDELTLPEILGDLRVAVRRFFE